MRPTHAWADPLILAPTLVATLPFGVTDHVFVYIEPFDGFETAVKCNLPAGTVHLVDSTRTGEVTHTRSLVTS